MPTQPTPQIPVKRIISCWIMAAVAAWGTPTQDDAVDALCEFSGPVCRFFNATQKVKSRRRFYGSKTAFRWDDLVEALEVWTYLTWRHSRENASPSTPLSFQQDRKLSSWIHAQRLKCWMEYRFTRGTCIFLKSSLIAEVDKFNRGSNGLSRGWLRSRTNSRTRTECHLNFCVGGDTGKITQWGMSPLRGRNTSFKSIMVHFSYHRNVTHGHGQAVDTGYTEVMKFSQINVDTGKFYSAWNEGLSHKQSSFPHKAIHAWSTPPSSLSLFLSQWWLLSRSMIIMSTAVSNSRCSTEFWERFRGVAIDIAEEECG